MVLIIITRAVEFQADIQTTKWRKGDRRQCRKKNSHNEGNRSSNMVSYSRHVIAVAVPQR